MVESDLQRLVNELIPFAERSLSVAGGFAPFGGTITTDSELEHVSVETESDGGAADDRGEFADADADVDYSLVFDDESADSSAEESVDLLTARFRRGAERGRYLAVAIFCDVVIHFEDRPDPVEAIRVNLEHVAGASLTIYIPYRTDVTGKIEYGEHIPEQAAPNIFS